MIEVNLRSDGCLIVTTKFDFENIKKIRFVISIKQIKQAINDSYYCNCGDCLCCIIKKFYNENPEERKRIDYHINLLEQLGCGG